MGEVTLEGSETYYTTSETHSWYTETPKSERKCHIIQ